MLGQANHRSKKIPAAQRDKHRQTRQIGLGLHIFHHTVFEADFLRAVVTLVLQVDEFRSSDGDIQHVNGLELEAGLFLKRCRPLAAAGFF